MAAIPAASGDSRSSLAAMGLYALGVVFGDIGTSPLYTFKTVLAYTGPHPDPTETLGALSLILWTLLVVVTIKYVNFAVRLGNDGEGGIITLTSLLVGKKGHRPAIVAAGQLGAALIYGDGAITPAISVLSALEGVEQIAPSLTAYVLPAAAVILLCGWRSRSAHIRRRRESWHKLCHRSLGAMSRVNPFTFNVEPDPLREERYRWTVCEGTQIHLRSPCSYATKEEAISEATKAAERLSSGERNG